MTMKHFLIHLVTALMELNLVYYGLHHLTVVTVFGLSMYGGTIALALAVVSLLIHCLVVNLTKKKK
ncbi:hypothetical protein AWJ19_25850 [Paenibacillus sp. DMB5]|nr:hypothetical protein AWJ19_25730 [Paenibacillus sp. DMB5]KUP26199.1 hypothetical protein AWJ19_25790 [Paenibacillus sp. DMB5]KUP26211.1 hypothetical protein AWJ19_25850 [Paenibacillus sp. DMB5]